MKILIFKPIALFILVFLFLSSCTINKTNDFTAQKYTQFKKGKNTVAISRPEIQKKDNPLLNNDMSSTISDIPIITDINSSNLLEAEFLAFSPEKKSPALALKQRVNEVKEPSLKRKEILSFVANRFIEKPNTTSAESGDVDLLLLVIIAIILPPLAVYLVRGSGTEFLISIILTILGWVPGQIYALLIVFDVI